MGSSKAIPVPPELTGDRIYLRPATAENVANTYHWYLASNPSMLSCEPVAFRTPAEAAEEFKKEEKSPYAQRFMIVTRKENDIVGWIRFFHVNTLNRSAEVELLIDPEERKNGHAVAALRILSRFLFRSRDLRKVYCQISSLNTAAIKTLEKAGFDKDGTLRNHYFYHEEYHHGLIYSLLLYKFER